MNGQLRTDDPLRSPASAAATESPSGFRGVIALDGPSGTGKSTVARRLAQLLGAQYLDTGAMYRAATVAALDAGVDLNNAEAVGQVVRQATIAVATDPSHQHTTLDGRLVDVEIRSSLVTANVSVVSAVPAVREVLVEQQRRIIAAAPTVAEGRDIGSVVWPQAELKVYLTASEEVRAQRRAGELVGATVADIAESIRKRDAFDSSRAVSPLIHADGAVEVDTSELSIDEVVELLAELALSDATDATDATDGNSAEVTA